MSCGASGKARQVEFQIGTLFRKSQRQTKALGWRTFCSDIEMKQNWLGLIIAVIGVVGLMAGQPLNQ
jgi:hypothetical protein